MSFTPPGARIVGAGAMTPLGHSSLHLAMAVRAGLSQRGTTSLDPFAADLPIESIAHIHSAVTGLARLVAVASPALVEACNQIEAPPTGFPLVIATPPLSRPDLAPLDSRAIIAALAAECPAPIDVRNATVVAGGSSAGAHVLNRALSWLERGFPKVLAGGVDSFTHPAVVTRLAELGMWAPDAPPQRFFAEGAGFVVLEGDPTTASSTVLEAAHAAEVPANIPIEPRDTEPPALVVGRARSQSLRRLGFDRASGSLEPGSQAVITDTLAGLIEQALANTDTSRCVAFTDVDHAPIRMMEWSEAAVRALPRGCRIQHVTRSLGDIGAANAAIWAALWTRWAEAGCAPAGLGLLAMHEEGRGRGVVSLRATTFAGGVAG